ncbi:hypothetical protein [Rhodococcus marinonascens]|uniref:hypothetical protein n=1 Tax=Rhodococcus marinonascens TaxID=38311 RepID=UPI0009335D3B|nr:hypothetical protein [Rhodococcus marinonascens]
MVTIILPVLLWFSAATVAIRWWRSRSLMLTGAALVFAGMAAHITVNMAVVDIPDVSRGLSKLLGYNNAASGVKHLIFMVIIWGVSLILVAMMDDDADSPSRRRLWVKGTLGAVMAVTVATAVMFFSTKEVPQASSGFEFDVLYGHRPGYAAAAALVLITAAVLCTAIFYAVIRQTEPRSSAGRGLLILSAGVAMIALYAWIRGLYFVLARVGWVEPTPVVFEQSTKLVIIAILLTVVGLQWSAVERSVVHIRHRRQFHHLHVDLVRRWPGVRRPSIKGVSRGVRLSDRAIEVLDALAMQAQSERLPIVSTTDHSAESVATWIATGHTASLGINSLQPPDQVTDTQWVRQIGREYARMRQ